MNPSRLKLLLAAALIAGIAHADPAPTDAVPADAVIRAAKAHARLAAAHFSVGSFDLAVPEYQAAYALDPRPELLFNLGQCQRQLGHRELAIEAYRRYLAAAPDGSAAIEAGHYIARLTRDLRDEAERAGQSPAAPAPRVPPPTAITVAPAPPDAFNAAPPATRRAPPPLSRRPWFWAALGGTVAVVAAGAITTAVLATTPREPVPALGSVSFGLR